MTDQPLTEHPLAERIERYLASRADGTQRTLHEMHPDVLLRAAHAALLRVSSTLVNLQKEVSEAGRQAIHKARAIGRREGLEEAAAAAEADSVRCVQEGAGSPWHALRIAATIRALATREGGND